MTEEHMDLRVGERVYSWYDESDLPEGTPGTVVGEPADEYVEVDFDGHGRWHIEQECVRPLGGELV